MRLLARRDHTRVELERKLAPYVEDPAELGALLDDYSARGWLSETRVVEQLLHAKQGRLGPARIRQTLLRKGVPENLIAPVMQELKATELEAARAIWSKKFPTPSRTPSERARQVRFLQSRGFSVEIAMRVVRRGENNESGDGD